MKKRFEIDYIFPYILWKKLFIVTVTMNKKYLIVTVTMNKKYLIVTSECREILKLKLLYLKPSLICKIIFCKLSFYLQIQYLQIDIFTDTISAKRYSIQIQYRQISSSYKLVIVIVTISKEYCCSPVGATR